VMHDKRIVEQRSFDIAELSFSDAPLATEWGNDTTGWDGTRWFEGRHYRRFVSGLHGHESGMSTEATIAAIRLGKQVDFEGLTGGYMDTYAYKGSNNVRVDRLVAHKEEDRTKALALADEWARDCLLVEGDFWMACAEPTYLAEAGGRISNRTCTYFTNGKAENGRKLRVHEEPEKRFVHNYVYRADRLDDAVAAAERHPHFRIGGGLVTFDSINVLMPETIRYDDDKPALLQSARDLMALCNHNPTCDTHPGILSALAALQDTIWNRTAAQIDGDVVASAFEKAVATHDALETHHVAREALASREYAQTLDRWYNRTVDLVIAGPAERLLP
jgi:hypothetical protein